MISHTAVRLSLVFLILSLALPLQAAVQVYTGQLEILVTSGKSCEGLAGSHDITLSVHVGEGASASVEGFFSGEGITIGRFSGTDLTRLDVHYPFHDELRAAGHNISISRLDQTLVAELHDRHVEADVEECNFDLARMSLVRSSIDNADALLSQMAGIFDAQLNRSQGLSIVQGGGGYSLALPYFEKALSLAEAHLPKDSEQINSYIIAVATSYIWLERTELFNTLYDTRIVKMGDESVRSVFSGYRIRTLMIDGRKALGREEYDSALKTFERAHELQPQNSEAVIAVVSVQLRRERYAEAITFLERAVKTLKNETDRKEVRNAMAMILAKKSQKDDKDGNGQEAELAMKKAMDLDPESVGYLIALARLRHKGGNLLEAEMLLDQGLEQFKDAASQKELQAARSKILQTEMILKKIRKVGS